jgi:hypothetical protein
MIYYFWIQIKIQIYYKIAFQYNDLRSNTFYFKMWNTLFVIIYWRLWGVTNGKKIIYIKKNLKNKEKHLFLSKIFHSSIMEYI